jgi:hypothetical protein
MKTGLTVASERAAIEKVAMSWLPPKSGCSRRGDNP